MGARKAQEFLGLQERPEVQSAAGKIRAEDFLGIFPAVSPTPSVPLAVVLSPPAQPDMSGVPGLSTFNRFLGGDDGSAQPAPVAPAPKPYVTPPIDLTDMPELYDVVARVPQTSQALPLSASDVAWDTAGSVANAGLGMAQSIPQIANFLTGDFVDLGMNKAFDNMRGKVTEATQSPEAKRLRAERESFIKRTDTGALGALGWSLQNPYLALQEGLQSAGSFLPAMGAGTGAGRLAQWGGATLSEAQRAATVGSIVGNALLNAGSTASDMEGSQSQRMLAGIISGLGTTLVNVPLRGSMEGMLARSGIRQAAGEAAAPVNRNALQAPLNIGKGIGKAAGTEFFQETGEGFSEKAGQGIARGEALDLPNASRWLKESIPEGVAGGLFGGVTGTGHSTLRTIAENQQAKVREAEEAAEATSREQAIEQFLEIASGRGDENAQQAEVPRAEDFLRERETQSAVPVEPATQVEAALPTPEQQNADLIPENQVAPEAEPAEPNIESVQQNQTAPTVFDNPTDAILAQVDATEATGVDHRIVANEDGTYTIAPVEMAPQETPLEATEMGAEGVDIPQTKQTPTGAELSDSVATEGIPQEPVTQAAPTSNEAHPATSETGEIVSQERVNLRHQARRQDADTKTLEGLKALSTKELLGRLKNVEQYERVYGLDERSSRFRRWIDGILAGRGEVQTEADSSVPLFSRGWRLSSAKTISDFVKKIVPEKGKHPKEVFVAGRVGERTRKRIFDATGTDVGDARILATADSIWHSQKEHPGMTPADYNRLMWAIENFDEVMLTAEPGSSKSQRLLFSAYDKETGYGYVADVNLGRNYGNRLNTITFFKDSAENIANWKNQERLRIENKKRRSGVPTDDAQGTTGPEGASAANTASDESVPQNSRARQSKVASPLPRGQVKNIADSILSGMKRAPSVMVVDRVADLPFGAPADARGAYRDGTVYVVAQNAASIEGVKETVFHEVREHFGLRDFFGNALDNALVSINNANPRIRGLADTWIAANQDVVSNLKSRYGWTDRDVRALAIEEAMAQMAESGQAITGIQRFAAAVQSLLRKMGMGRLANMLEARTDAEAMRMLAQADLFLQTGETVESRSSRVTEAAQAYSRDAGHINPDYGKEVDDIKSGRRIRPAVLGMPSNMLLRSGIPNRPLIITKGTIEKDMVGRHNLTLEQIKWLPYRLGYPLMVFKSSDVNNPDRSVALINDAEKYPDGREEPIVVAIEPNGRVERIRVNEIKSAYGKENIGTALTNWTREGLLVSAQKKITEKWLTTRGLQLPNVVQAINSDSVINLSEPDTDSQEKNTPPLFSHMGDDVVPQESTPQATSTSNATHPVDSETGEIISREEANLRYQAERRDANIKTIERLKALSTKELLGQLKNVEQYERTYGLDEHSSRFRKKIGEIPAGRGEVQTIEEKARTETEVTQTPAETDDGVPLFSRGWRLSTAKTISDFVKKIAPEKGKHPKEVFVAGRVSERTRRRILDSTGIDVGDARILATADSIWHSQKEHSGMTPDGYNKLMWTIENFDDVVLTADTGLNRAPRLLFSAYDRGTGYGYVADVSVGRNYGNRLNTVTFFKDSAENVANWKNQELLRVENKERGSDVPTGDVRSALTPEDATAANTASDGSVPQNSRTRQSKVASPLTRGQVVNTALSTLKGMKRAPSVVVVDRVADLPFDTPADARGAYRDGTVYVLAENAASIEGVKETVFHEVRGHFGLRGFFGKELDNALIGINNANPRIRGLADTWIANNQNVVGDLKSRYGWTDRDVRALAIEEAMAQMAESGQTITGIQRFAAAVQSLLRKIGMSRLANMLEARTDAEAMHMLAQADLFLQTGETKQPTRETDAAPMYSRDNTARELRINSSSATRQDAESALLKIRGKNLKNLETGIVVQINNNQATKLVSNVAAKKSVDNGFSREQHYSAVSNIENLWKHATQINERTDRNNAQNVLSIKQFAVSLTFDTGRGEPAFAIILAKETEEHGHRAYTLELQEIETLRGMLGTFPLQDNSRTPSQSVGSMVQH
ncbi:MAG: hypothetical protein LBK01_00410, partial [Burkholderiaceae bacterium]|nr:hypothetical protein [Burkholderiaceae bacterium]